MPLGIWGRDCAGSVLDVDSPSLINSIHFITATGLLMKCQTCKNTATSCQIPEGAARAGLAILLAHERTPLKATFSDRTVLPWSLLRQHFRVSRTDLHWLLDHNLIRHQEELSPKAHARNRRQLVRSRITPTSHFVPNPIAIPVLWELATAAIHNSQRPTHTRKTTARQVKGQPRPKPLWKTEERELWVGKTLVKGFKRTASNQELILSVFEEEGWPEWIDDPLPIAKNIQPKQRLKDAVKSLNRQQKNSVLHFYGDFVNGRIQWKLAPPDRPPERH